MVFRILESDLSPNGMDNLAKEISKLSKSITNLNDNFLEISLGYLKERAQYYIRSTVGKTGYVPTGDLENSFSETQITVGDIEFGILKNTAWHSAFAEFGTGLMGKKVPHELSAELGWMYDVNSHGEDGWWYWGDDGKQHWTRGMTATRYMYRALMDYVYNGGKEACMKNAMGELNV